MEFHNKYKISWHFILLILKYNTTLTYYNGARLLKAVYPGSFDPLTNGHLDIIKRSYKLFSPLVVAVVENPKKSCLFSLQERKVMIKEALNEVGITDVQVDQFQGLLIDYVKSINAIAIVRGLRALTDFEYELSFSHMNHELDNKIETVFLMTHQENSFLSSHLIKEVSSLGGDISSHVPKNVLKALNEKFKTN